MKDLFLGTLCELHIEQTGLGTIVVEADAANESTLPGRYAFRVGTTVTLKAIPEAGYVFDSWSGDRDSFEPREELYINRESWLRPRFEPLIDPWLVMVYVAGANDLELEALMDLNAMEAGLANAKPSVRSRLRVVALVDRMASDVVDDGNWTGTRLYELRPDKRDATLGSMIVPSASVGGQAWRTGPDDEMSMGKAETLASFVAWAKEAYPDYRRRALILWNHGSGVFSSRSVASRSVASRSVCYDDEDLTGQSYGLDGQLHIGELSDALAPVLAGERLEFMGFDACHMGLYEIAYELRGAARYFAGSPTSVAGGWPYDRLFSSELALRDGAAFAQEASRLYAATTFGKSLTAFDLDRIEAVRLAVDSLATSLKQSGTGKAHAESARDAAWLYASPDVPSKGYYYSRQYPYRDLAHLCERLMEQEGPTSDVKDKATAVTLALKAGTIRSWCRLGGAEYPQGQNAYGLGILFPLSDSDQDGRPDFREYHAHYYVSESSEAYYGRLDAAAPGDTWRGMLDEFYP